MSKIKLTEFYANNLRHYYNEEIISKKLMNYQFPYDTVTFMEDYSIDNVKYKYEKSKIIKKVKHALDNMFKTLYKKLPKEFEDVLPPKNNSVESPSNNSFYLRVKPPDRAKPDVVVKPNSQETQETQEEVQSKRPGFTLSSLFKRSQKLNKDLIKNLFNYEVFDNLEIIY